MRKRFVVIKFICLLLFPITIILQRIFSQFPKVIEKTYSQFLYKKISIPISTIIEKIPFSVSSIVNYSFVILVILYVIKIIYKLFLAKEKRLILLKNTFLNTFALLGILYFLFMINWGFNYVRVPFTDTMGLDIEEKEIDSTDELYKMCDYLVLKTEELQLELDYSNKYISDSKEFVISSILERSGKGYKNLSNKYAVFKGNYPQPKRILFNSINNISGSYSPFLFESNVNTSVPLNLLPFISCHEKAHQYGYAGEDEASLIAYISCKSHTDIDFNYSGKLFALHESLSILRNSSKNEYTQIIKKCNTKITNNLLEIDNFENNQQKGVVSYFNSKIYDLYLKTNMQEEGMQSYSGVVKLLLSLYESNQL